MRLIEAEKVEQVMKDYWKAQVNKALTLTADVNEANKRINSYLEHNHDLLKAIDELPSAQSETEAISEWKKEFREYVDSLDIARDDWKGIIEYIDELPSVQPERKTGHWVKSDMQRWYDVWLCSECGEKTDSAVMSKPRYKYCPMCGAKMERGDIE